MDMINCEHCVSWCGGTNKILASIAGSHVWVGQCASESTHAPYVNLDNAEAFVFTPASGLCPAFEMHPDIAADMAADKALYAGLERDRAREIGAR